MRSVHPTSEVLRRRAWAAIRDSCTQPRSMTLRFDCGSTPRLSPRGRERG